VIDQIKHSVQSIIEKFKTQEEIVRKEDEYWIDAIEEALRHE
jgi:hypothetical protein